MIKWMVALLSLSFSCFGGANFYRTIWHPSYHNMRLNWCDQQQKNCGMQVAKQYCRQLGYPEVIKIKKATDIGLSRYIDSNVECNTPYCDGFSFIKCGANQLADGDYYTTQVRKKVFYYPRLKEVRIDWCFEKGKRCGKRAAYAFCRAMGYSNAKGFKQDSQVSQTRTIGGNDLCVGRKCKSFSEIQCVRW
jgi:hypothetical protein